MLKEILLSLLVVSGVNAFAQSNPSIIQEVRLENGKTIFIYSNGTWKEKVYKKPIIEWVNIQAGNFTMGRSLGSKSGRSDEVRHTVSLSSFRMSKYEITLAQYDMFCDATGRNRINDEIQDRTKYPANGINWNDANEFANWLGCRLPTEAEWEYACRAGTTTDFNTGNCITPLVANVLYNPEISRVLEDCPGVSSDLWINQNKALSQVGSFKPNSWGLFDMHGNVSEWCNDWYAEYDLNVTNNPKGPVTGKERVARGGSIWGSVYYCRSSFRDSNLPIPQEAQIANYGIRLVR